MYESITRTRPGESADTDGAIVSVTVQYESGKTETIRLEGSQGLSDHELAVLLDIPLWRHRGYHIDLNHLPLEALREALEDLQVGQRDTLAELGSGMSALWMSLGISSRDEQRLMWWMMVQEGFLVPVGDGKYRVAKPRPGTRAARP